MWSYYNLQKQKFNGKELNTNFEAEVLSLLRFEQLQKFVLIFAKKIIDIYENRIGVLTVLSFLVYYHVSNGFVLAEPFFFNLSS